MISDPKILGYLHFNYVPDLGKWSPVAGVVPDLFEGAFNDAKIYAGELLVSIVRRAVEQISRPILIPLSGGLDSRALLAAAIEVGADIQTVTFGRPGSMDYEYGKAVAAEIGVAHRSVDLSLFSPSTEDLVQTARSGGSWTYMFDAYYNRRAAEVYIGSVGAMMGGYLGDPIAGSHMRRDRFAMANPKQAFVASQHFSRRRRLVPEHIDIDTLMPDVSAGQAPASVTHFEWYDLNIRQPSGIYPIVRESRFAYIAPFADPRWVGFMLGLPPEWRWNSRLYHAALFARWPELFSLPTKTYSGLGLNAGAGRRFTAKWAKRLQGRLTGAQGRRIKANYIDFDIAFREPGPMRDMVRENLADLDGRKLLSWLNAESFLGEHQKGGRLDAEIRILVGLEVNLKAQALSQQPSQP